MTDSAANLGAPVPLTAQHDLEDFQSGETILDDWLRQRALNNMETAASKTYVVCPLRSRKVIGFYALCMGQILNQEVTGAMRRNMPRHIPAVILGRLAIDRDWQGNGIGAALLHDAVQRSVRAAEEVSARLLIVHAISPAAEAFYLRYGFTRLPVETPTLALDLMKLTHDYSRLGHGDGLGDGRERSGHLRFLRPARVRRFSWPNAETNLVRRQGAAGPHLEDG